MSRHLRPSVAAVFGVLLLGAALRGSGGDAPNTQRSNSLPQIPPSIRTEHQAIHSALEDATKQPGRVGQAARRLADVLDPHFVREEQIALPPLGLLAPLAAGMAPAEAAEVLAMTDTLKRELPAMLAEHTRIRAAVAALREAARAEHAVRYEQLADQLTLHAQTEEEVLYPAAVLVGDILRARSAQYGGAAR